MESRYFTILQRMRIHKLHENVQYGYQITLKKLISQQSVI